MLGPFNPPLEMMAQAITEVLGAANDLTMTQHRLIELKGRAEDLGHHALAADIGQEAAGIDALRQRLIGPKAGPR